MKMKWYERIHPFLAIAAGVAAIFYTVLVWLHWFGVIDMCEFLEKVLR